MAQIFVSHSAKDKDLVALLSKAFAPTPVRAIFEEFDAILKGPANVQRIAQDIRQSNAVFVLLGKNVEELRHTRDVRRQRKWDRIRQKDKRDFGAVWAGGSPRPNCWA